MTEDLVGKQFGDLLVIKELEPAIYPSGIARKFNVVCTCCGREFNWTYQRVKEGKKCRSCAFKDRRKDLTGQKINFLYVESMAEDYISPSGHRLSQCNCICDCGNKIIVSMNALLSGATKSCGCLQNTRGLLKDYKEVMEEYDFEKNNIEGVDLETLTGASHTKIWWKCKVCGESWKAAISSHTNKKKHGCPYCSGLLVREGVNDLKTKFPDIAEEWNYEKNKNLKNKRLEDITRPEKVSSNSSLKVWWKCKECGHEWMTQISNRTARHSECPKCSRESHTSFTEQAVYFYVKQLFPDSINGDKSIGMELDIFIPSKKIGIEYDGDIWHNKKHKENLDDKKNLLCEKNGVKLLRIREPKCKEISNCMTFLREDSNSEESLSKVIKEVIQYLDKNNNLDVDVKRDSPLIQAQYASKKYQNSLEYCCPEVVKDWDYELNGDLTPDKVHKGSRRVVYWKCHVCGYSWKTPVSNRTRTVTGMRNGKERKPTGCPECYKNSRNFPVVCIETNEYFKTGLDAAKSLGKNSASSIYKSCRGEVKSAFGYHWKFYKE